MLPSYSLYTPNAKNLNKKLGLPRITKTHITSPINSVHMVFPLLGSSHKAPMPRHVFVNEHTIVHPWHLVPFSSIRSHTSTLVKHITSHQVIASAKHHLWITFVSFFHSHICASVHILYTVSVSMYWSYHICNTPCSSKFVRQSSIYLHQFIDDPFWQLIQIQSTHLFFIVMALKLYFGNK